MSETSQHPSPPWVGSRSRWAGSLVFYQTPWSFGFDPQTRGFLSRTPIEATPLSTTSAELGSGLGLGLGSHSCNDNPLVDERTGAGHADVRLGGLWNRNGLKRVIAACGRGGFNQN
jgi:hypothetical protein